jgi:4'-phosphopantetheinyl transferase
VLRSLLGSYLRLPARAIEFRYTNKGKPELRQPAGGLHFNISHSGSWALLAFADTAVGVDVERIRPDLQALEIARRFFSREEFESLASLTGHARERGFFACWTRKEACIKALGHGLSARLDRICVPVDPHIQIAEIALATESGEHSHWSMMDIPLEEGYCGAVVFRGALRPVRHLFWTEVEQGIAVVTGKRSAPQEQ